MLQKLHIENFAIIDDLTFVAGSGLNILVGETGAGKSIIIDSINLVLGDRASSEMIRTGEKEALVEAQFKLQHDGPIVGILEREGIEFSDKLHIKRLIHSSGRNKIFINGVPSTIMVLSEIGHYLIDICGQSQHQALTRTEEHIEYLDRFGELGTLRQEMAESFRRYRVLQGELDGFKAKINSGGADEDYLRHQSQEIENAALRPGEEDELKKEKAMLRNAEILVGLGVEAEKALYSESGSVTEVLGSVVKKVREASAHDATLSDVAESLESALFEIEDKATFLRDYSSAIEGDPNRLESIEERLDVISRLKKKHETDLEGLLKKKEQIDRAIEAVSGMEEKLEMLTVTVLHAKNDAFKTAKALSLARKEKSVALKSGVEKELGDLGLKDSVFEVILTGEDIEDKTGLLTEKGTDRVAFYISTNPGEAVKPIAKIASGGELSRIMLALKGLTAVGRVPSIIFDEVDTGVGATMADVVAEKLAKVAEKHQV
ncbi:MAG: DNA repair protein RecN, partial [Deltaproteobacteria bacterium]|nr:DNA repair protein RecN [Deltaproteobacteria bacterium]